jgi:hypothetical protein
MEQPTFSEALDDLIIFKVERNLPGPENKSKAVSVTPKKAFTPRAL